jgi:NTP pyrophosphatase (non-canonical NTP hydrolase)
MNDDSNNADDEGRAGFDPGFAPSGFSGLNELARKAWEQEKPYFGDNSAIEEIAHISTELTEAIHELREGHGEGERWTEPDGKPRGVPVEMADIILGALRFCGKYGIDIEKALRDKMKYNGVRTDWAERAAKTRK